MIVGVVKNRFIGGKFGGEENIYFIPRKFSQNFTNVIFRKSETSFSPGEKIKNIDKMISKNKLDEKWNKFN